MLQFFSYDSDTETRPCGVCDKSENVIEMLCKERGEWNDFK